MANRLWADYFQQQPYGDDVGLVTKAVGGLCGVYTPRGDMISCRIRGRIKQDGVRILPGDFVRIERLSGNEGVIEAILPRRSELQRPFIANADQVAVVISVAEPAPIPELIDRILVAAIGLSLQPILVWNKVDLVERARLEDIVRPYELTGFPMVETSSKSETGYEALKLGLQGHLSVLAGPSGAGKSSLLNWLLGEKRFATGEISERLQRGRHTTRAVELVSLDGDAWIADTPGFSVLDLSQTPLSHISRAYPEMLTLAAECRFAGCTHRSEPGCRVQSAVDGGQVHRQRYETYVRLWDEVETYEATKYN